MPTIQKLLTGRAPITMRGDATVLRAAETMSQDRVGAVVVVDDDGQPVGIFTERDLMVRVVVPRRDPATLRLEEVMTRELFTVAPGRATAEVRQQLQSRHIRHIPVVEEGRLIEVLSLRDVLRHDLEACSREVQHLTDYIQGEGS